MTTTESSKEYSRYLLEFASVLDLVRTGVDASYACLQTGMSRSTFYSRIRTDPDAMARYNAARKEGMIQRRKRHGGKKDKAEYAASLPDKRSRESLFSQSRVSSILTHVRAGANHVDAAMAVKWPLSFLELVISEGTKAIREGDYLDSKASFVLELEKAQADSRIDATERTFLTTPELWLTHSPQGITPSQGKWSKAQTLNVEKTQEIKISTAWSPQPLLNSPRTRVIEIESPANDDDNNNE